MIPLAVKPRIHNCRGLKQENYPATYQKIEVRRNRRGIWNVRRYTMHSTDGQLIGGNGFKYFNFHSELPVKFCPYCDKKLT